MAPAASVMMPRGPVLDTRTDKLIRLYKTSPKAFYQRQWRRQQAEGGLPAERLSPKPVKPVHADLPLTHLGNLGEGEPCITAKPPMSPKRAVLRKHVAKPEADSKSREAALLAAFMPAPVPEGNAVLKWVQNLREVNERMRLDGMHLMSPYNMRKPNNPAWFVDYIDLPDTVEEKPVDGMLKWAQNLDAVNQLMRLDGLRLMSPYNMRKPNNPAWFIDFIDLPDTVVVEEKPVDGILKWAQNLDAINQLMRLEGIRLMSPYNMRKPNNPAWFIDFIDFIDLPDTMEKKPEPVVAELPKVAPALVPSPPPCLPPMSGLSNGLKKKRSRIPLPVVNVFKKKRSLIPVPVVNVFNKYKVLPAIQRSV